MKTEKMISSPFNDWQAYIKSLDWRDDRIYHENIRKAFWEAVRLGVSQSIAFVKVANMIYLTGRHVDQGDLQALWLAAQSESSDLQNGNGINHPPVPLVPNDQDAHKAVHGKGIVKTSAHELFAKTVVIDGQNVIYGSPSDPKPSLLNLLGLQIELLNHGCNFKCFFDANTFFTLLDAGRKHEAYAYRRLSHDFPDVFIEVPGGSEADAFLLDYAHTQRTPIISNDRYRDYTDKYKWLQSERNRRICFLVHSGMMQIVQLSIQVVIPKDLAVAEAALRSALGKQVSTNCNAPVPINGTTNGAMALKAT